MKKKQYNKHVRKLTRLGKYSLAITLPAEYLSDLNWREKQNVTIAKRGKQLIISDWE